MCREQGTARSAGEVASSARRHAPSKRHTYVFDKTSQATSISSGGLCCRGKQSRGIIASRESGLSAAPKSSRRPRFERRRLRGPAVATPSPPARGGGVGPPADCEAGERWRHVWCARQNRLPLFAVLRLDARAKCARGSSTVGCCVWAFGTVGRTRSSSGDSGHHRSACTAHLGASDGLNSFAALLRRADE